MDVSEARKKLEACLSEDTYKEYFAVLRQYLLFKDGITKSEFDSRVRKILSTQEEIRCHNHFLLAIFSKISNASKVKTIRNTYEKGSFECADYTDYVSQSSNSMTTSHAEYKIRNASAELFMPDSGFIACRIAVTAWDNGLHGAADNVTELMVHCCHVFVKNIITAMISRIKGYKIRDNKFQYGFNMPIADPFTRNYNNILDTSQESKVAFLDDMEVQIPKCRPSLERAEQELAFAYSGAKRRKMDNILSVKLLYETVRDNPQLLGATGLSSINFLKHELYLDTEEETAYEEHEEIG